MPASQDNAYQEFLSKLTVDEIQRQYEAGDIPTEAYVQRLRNKARQELSIIEQGNPFVTAVLKQSKKNFMEGWDNLIQSSKEMHKEISDKEKEQPGSLNLVSTAGAMKYAEIKGMWGMAQMLFSLMGSGLGDVAGMRIENNALKQGYSPGASRLLGFVADVAAGSAVPVQSVARGIVGVGAKVAPAAIVGKASTDAQIMRGMAESMELDGIEGVSKFLDNVMRKAGQTPPAGLTATTSDLAKQVVRSFSLGPGKVIDNKTVYPVLKEGVETGTGLVIKGSTSAETLAVDYIGGNLPVAGAESGGKLGTSGIKETIMALFESHPNAKRIVADRPSGRIQVSREDALARMEETAARLEDLAKVKPPSAMQSDFIGTARSIANDLSVEQARNLLPPLMKKLGISYPDLKTIKAMWTGTGSRAMDVRDFYSYLKALDTKSGELAPLARRAIAEGASQADQMAFARAATELFTGPKEKLEYSKDFINLLLHWDPKNVANGDIAAAMKTFATDIARATPTQAARFSFKSQDGYIRFGDVMPAVKEVFVNLLLPVAGVPAFFGNSIGAMDIIASRVMAGHPIEAAYGVKAMAWATADAMRAFKMAYQTSGARGVIPGIGGQVIRFPSDSMVAMDASFKVIVGRASLYMDALRATQGMANRGQLIKNFVQNPPGQAIEDATERAYRATYQNDLGAFAKQFADLVRSGPGNPGSFFFTFFKSPLNLVKWGWDRTPALQFLSGRLWHDIVSGGTLASDAVGRLTMASLQANMVWELAKEGFITGTGPAESTQRKAWLLNHKPNSIRTPSGWITMNNADPMTMPITLVADMAAISDQLDPDSVAQLSLAAAYVFMNNVANRTAYRTLGELMDLAQSRERAEKLTPRQMTKAIAPFISTAVGGALTQRLESIVDPVTRDARTVLEQFKKRVPGYAPDVPPLRDGLGDPVIPPTAVGSPWFGFFAPMVPKMNPLEADPLKKEVSRIEATLPNFPDYIGAPPRDDLDITQPLPGNTRVGVYITSKQRERWQQLYRNVIRHPTEGLQALIDDPEYKQWPLARQRAEVNSFVSQAKELAKEHLLIEDVELAKKVSSNEARNIMPLEQPEDRPQVQQAYEEEQNMIDQLSEQEKENIAKWGFLEPDKPYTQPPVTVGGYEVVGPRTYQPADVKMEIGSSRIQLQGDALKTWEKGEAGAKK